jgi:galactose mutarotase-like enzyme
VADSVTISSGELTASISVLGAELQSLKDSAGRELMTDANPAFWTGRAPLLFPIVGRLHDDSLRINGHAYAMQKHGFARKSVFRIIEVSAKHAIFRLVDSNATRIQYPFAFELDARFSLEGKTLYQTVAVRNNGDSEMPFSFGFHPAFAWPLPAGGAREDHCISFEHPEPASLARVTPYGTIAPDPVPSPVDDRSFALHDALFGDDALVWRELSSHRLDYGAPGFPSLDIEFPDTSMLGIWTKPGAGFVCIEPWAGIADPEGFAGAFADKPGIMHLLPGCTRSFRMNVRLAD